MSQSHTFYFSKASESYDAQATVQKHTLARLLTLMSEGEMQVPATGLDIGCGPGTSTVALAARYPNTAFTGMDSSLEMVRTAQRTIHMSNVTFQVGDGEQFVTDKTYDVIASNATFQWFKHFHTTIPKLKSQLTENGRLVFSMFGPGTFQELRQSLSLVMGHPILLASSGFLTQEVVVDVLKGSFKHVTVEQELVRKPFPSFMALLRHIKETGTRGSSSIDKWIWSPDFVRKLESVYRAHYGWIVATFQVYYYHAHD